jgi:hypothetical protein
MSTLIDDKYKCSWFIDFLIGWFIDFLIGRNPICIAVGDPFIKKGKVGTPLTGLNPPHLCACLKPGPVSSLIYVQWFEVRGDCLFC